MSEAAKLDRRAHVELSRAVTSLVFDEPFFGHLLSGVNRSVTTQTQTAAVAIAAGRPILMVNSEFFVTHLTRKGQRVAVVKHEALHLLLKHLFRADWTRVDRLVMNIAADVVVNQFIGRKWELPEGAVTLASFPELDLPANQTMDWYYDRLLPARDDLYTRFSRWHSDHDLWGEAETPADVELARREVAKLAKLARSRSGSSYGSLPGNLREEIDALIDELEPTVDWRRVLRLFANSSRNSRIANTLRRPSKRYDTYPGIKVKRHHRLAVAIDTSGSVSDADLAAFFGEIRGIWREGSEITVIECDAAVQRTYEFEGRAPKVVLGRGGTAFDPVFTWVSTQRKVRFDAVIYLTDGCAAEPTVDPQCPVLWVLTPDGSPDALAFGRSIAIARR